MRVVSGKYRGQTLNTFQATHIRPTTDRVKESLFNIVPFSIENSFVLDLFCGTGNLGIEALSRGAKKVYFVDDSPASLKITRSNLEKLGIPEQNYRIFKQDVLNFLEKYQDQGFDLILVDPPFTKKMAHSVMQIAAASKAFSEETILAIESERRERLDEVYSGVNKYSYREFGDKILSFFCKEGNNP